MAIELLEADKPETIFDSDWFDKEYLNCLVDPKERVARPETLLSIGEYDYKGNSYPVPVMTAGEFSCISAPSKAKKSFLKSAFAASFVGGDSNNHFENIKGHRKDEDIIIDIDTEQSKYYAARTFARVGEMAGSEYSEYYPFKMRHLTPEKRVAFIDNLLRSRRFENKVKIVFIDGIADLVEDTNDLVMSNYIAGKLLQWTDEYNIHVCVIIHNAYNTLKPTGHLGSAVVKKAESVILLEPGDDEKHPKDVIKVSSLYSRGRSFEDFHFKINNYNALPYECDERGNFFSSEMRSTDPAPVPASMQIPDYGFDDDDDTPF